MHDRFVLLKRPSELNDKDMPLLVKAYRAKEAFYGIWDTRNRSEAEARYLDWFSNLSDDLEPAFAPLITAMGNWCDQIFAYFSVPGAATNAPTEMINGLGKIANRQERGYSFEVIRAKIL